MSLILPAGWNAPCSECGEARARLLPNGWPTEGRHAATCPKDLAIKARQAAEKAQAEQAAVERTFTGERFDGARSLKETARLIRADLEAAATAGTLPPDRYRVTVRRERGWRPILCVWTSAPLSTRPIRDAIRAIANRYNRNIGHIDAYYDARDETVFEVNVMFMSPATAQGIA